MTAPAEGPYKVKLTETGMFAVYSPEGLAIAVYEFTRKITAENWAESLNKAFAAGEKKGRDDQEREHLEVGFKSMGSEILITVRDLKEPPRGEGD